MIWTEETCTGHVTLAERPELAMLKDGTALMFGVKIRHPFECLRCGKKVSFFDYSSRVESMLKDKLL